MNLKTKVKSYSFWVSLASAVILILKLVGQKFGFSVDEGLISDLFTSLCAILVILGIIVVPSSISIDQSVTASKQPLVEKHVIESEIKNKQDENNKVEISTNDIKKNSVAKQKEIKKEFEESVVDSFYQSENIENAEVEQCFENCQKENDNIAVNEIARVDLTAASFSLESFIDKVCTKRNELSGNVMNFVEFLQNEIDNIKKQ